MRKKICFVVTIPEIVHAFLKDHIDALSKDYDIYIAGDIQDPKKIEGLSIQGYYNISICRKISLRKDVKSLWLLIRYLHKMKFDVVHSAMPKAGLVSAVASFITRVPNRIHIFTGQVWATSKGAKRILLKSMDRIICLFDNYIIADGKSQCEFLIQENIVKPEKIRVFGEGSICGVNIERFKPCQSVRQSLRHKYHITEKDVVFIFLGRLNHDKGVFDILSAFNKLTGEFDNTYLFLAGADEDGCLETLYTYPNIERDKNLFYFGYVNDPQNYLQAGDVFCLPSYREGFGSSVIEAACLGIPSICSDVYGLRDAMVDGVTGLRCHVGSVDSLYNCMKEFCINKDMIRDYGVASRKRVLNSFSGGVITNCWVDFYHDIVK